MGASRAPGDSRWGRLPLFQPGPLSGPAWQVPAGHPIDDGAALLAAAAQQGLAGVIAKRLDGEYRGGPAEDDWMLVTA